MMMNKMSEAVDWYDGSENMYGVEWNQMVVCEA